MNKYFDKIVCISLVEREDKKLKIAKRFAELDIEVDWYRPVIHSSNKNIIKYINSTPTTRFNLQHPNEIGASLSHYTVVKTAYLQGVERLFVFEDDVLLHKDWDVLFPKYMDKVPDWDMLMLYSFMYELKPQNVRLNSRWMKAYNSWSLTSYGMNRKMMKTYIDFQDAYFCISDLATYNLQERDDLNMIIAVPPLCIPNVDVGSDIRVDMNYKTTRSIIMTGVNEDDYI